MNWTRTFPAGYLGWEAASMAPRVSRRTSLAWVTRGEGKSLKPVSLAKFTILRVDSPEPVEGFEIIRISFHLRPAFRSRKGKGVAHLGCEKADAAASFVVPRAHFFESSKVVRKARYSELWLWMHGHFFLYLGKDDKVG
jgi:hypothetical protein